MAKKLTAKTSDFDGLLVLTTRVDPKLITQGAKLSSFRRAIKLALKDYLDGMEKVLKVFRDDLEEYKKKYEDKNKEEPKGKKATETKAKELEELLKAMDGIKKEADTKVIEYKEKNDKEMEVTFDNEAYGYTQTLMSESANTLFSMQIMGPQGPQEQYNQQLADNIFDLLDTAK